MSKAHAITLTSQGGLTVTILTLGGIITEILAVNRDGVRENVVLNYPNLTDYEANPSFLGCLIGPVAGRSKNGQIFVDERVDVLDTHLHPNSLHSGTDGLHQVYWTVSEQSDQKVTLTYTPEDGAFPWNQIHYAVTYTVSAETLTIDYFATSKVKAYLSMTNHSYFNLSGNPETTILSHELTLNCSHFARIDSESLPTELVPLEGSALDFSNKAPLEKAVSSSAPDILIAAGIDHPFKCHNIANIAVLTDAASGRQLKVSTTQPYVVIYSGNFLAASESPSGYTFTKHAGICFETQDLPNITENPLDDICYLDAEHPYTHRTVFEFSPL
ncbi:MAG: galactose mutarotase [Firmicutes bacterium]|nr:galactose mutarotase [Bacillota bacterium]